MTVTRPAVSDALHGAHGCEATDERAALLLHAVGLHLQTGETHWFQVSMVTNLHHQTVGPTLHPPLVTTNSAPPPQQTRPGSCSTFETGTEVLSEGVITWGHHGRSHLHDPLGRERVAVVHMHHVCSSSLEDRLGVEIKSFLSPPPPGLSWSGTFST